MPETLNERLKDVASPFWQEELPPLEEPPLIPPDPPVPPLPPDPGVVVVVPDVPEDAQQIL